MEPLGGEKKKKLAAGLWPASLLEPVHVPPGEQGHSTPELIYHFLKGLVIREWQVLGEPGCLFLHLVVLVFILT